MKKILLSLICCLSTLVLLAQTPITGTFTLCQGSTTNLANATTGGTWSSSNVVIASVGSSTGVVFGNSAGVATITYSFGSSGFVVQDVTVNPLPGAITSTSSAGMSVCEGSTITLTNPTPGGTWVSNTPAVATIGSSTGVVTGVSAGTTIISYILPTGCFATSLVMVNPTPGPITGPSQVCVGSTIILSGTGGGVWSSASPSVATIGSGTGIVTGVSAGTSVITYMLSTGCYVTTTITVNPLPGPMPGAPGTPPISICVGSSITLTNSVAGGIWTSGTPAVATIGSTSGVLTGIAAGTATITYTLPTGCFATTVITVNPVPSAITGPTSVCVGSTIILTGSGGGVWSSGTPTVATIGSASGVVTGVSAGTSVITYMLSTGCYVTTTITVYPTPSAIVGTVGLPIGSICVGDVITISSTPPGGIWTSGTPSVATVGSSSGVVTGVSAGTTVITYTLPGGCFTTVTITVNPTPTAITGPTQVCAGSTIALACSPGGGVWSSGSPSVAGVGSSTGVVTGVSVGTAVISYMLTGGCFATTTITVNPVPVIGVSTGIRLCVGSSTTLPATPTGGVWTSGAPGIATVGSSSGVVTGVSAGVATITYTLSTGCFATTVVTIDPMPTAITGPTQVCVGSTISLSSSPGGGVWTSGSPTVAGVGSSTGIVTGVSAGTAVITYMLPAGCFVTTTVTVNPVPTLGISTGIHICVGSSITLPASPGGGIWTSGAPGVATVGSLSGVVTGVSAGVATITYTLSTGCFATMSVTVDPMPAAITGPTQVCVGSSIALASSPGGGVWSSGNPSVATVGSSTGVVTGVSAGTAVITYMLPAGCFVTTTITVNPVPVIGGTTGAHLCVGSSLTLAATPAGGVWTSGAPGVATVGSSSGVITGISAGVATITYTLSTGCFTAIAVTVDPVPSAITGPTQVCVGSTIALSSSPGSGLWTSGSPSIATVGSSTGVVTGVSAGTAVITYMLPGGCYVTTSITVNPVPVIGLSTGAHVCVGGSFMMTATPVGGVWTSGNTTIAIVGSSSGVVTGIAAGTAVITYMLPTGCFATSTVTVNPNPVITGPGVVCVGSSINLTGSPTGGVWTSGSTSIAGVGSSSGIVTGLAPGTSVITYTLPTGCSVSVTITVNPIPTAIVGSTVGALLCVGSSISLSSSPSGGIWTSSNTTIAIVGSSSGIVTAMSPGTVTITYTLPTGCSVSTFITIIPSPSPITGITTVCVGGTTTLSCPGGGTWSSGNPSVATIGSGSGVVTGILPGTAVITYTLPSGCSTTTTVTVTSGVGPITGVMNICVGATTILTGPGGGIWSSGNPSVASVGSSTGVVTGVSAGTATITYTLSTGCIGTAVVTVNPLPGPIVGPAMMCVGNTATFSCIPPGGTWTSSNTSVATIGAISGVANAIAPGTTIITYTLPTGCSVSRTLVVNPSPGPITGPNTLCAGSVIVLTGSGGGTWTSSNPLVASVVVSSGVVTGVSAGTATITYQLSTGCYSTMTITVNPMPSAITGPPYVCLGSSVTLTSSPTGGVWTSSNPAIATVGSSTGVVTGIAVGSVTITYTLAGGCYVTYTLPVKPLPCWPAAVNSVTGVDEGLTIFPNPAYDELTIETETAMYNEYTITNEIGQEIIRDHLKGKRTNVDIKSLSSGCYYISIRGDSGNMVRKFIKI